MKKAAHRRACGGGQLYYRIQNFVALVFAELLEFLTEALVVEREDGYGKQRSVLGSVDGHGSDGYAGWHLHY